MRIKAALIAAAVFFGISASANAATYSWSFDCGTTVCSGSGLLTTDVDVSTGNAIAQTMTGTFGSATISNLLAPGTFPETGSNDNKILSLISPQLTIKGVSAALSSGLNLNLFYGGSSAFWCMTNGGCPAQQFGRFSLTAVSAVPLPAALPLLGAGLAGLGAMGWMRRRRAQRATA